ncbi:MAG: N-acetylneuraminate synthase family protein, partial [Rhodospirillales bacterium]|nr:N-acetylneuraminate synthase family protein [Rhodospirillales bacterium]
MTNSLCIRGRAAIGEGLPPYLIAEIGTNHNRDLETARRLVRTVAEQGFDCAKFQIYEVDEIVAGSVRTGDYGLDGLYGDITAQAMFARHLQTPKAWFPELKDLCHDLGIDCAVTIHGHQGRNWAASIGFDLIKIASMDHTNTPFLKGLVNQIEPPILISSGMAQLEDIERALAALEGHRSGIGLFHCVAVYPPEPTELRLANIPFLSHRFALPIGFSDHTTDTV